MGGNGKAVQMNRKVAHRSYLGETITPSWKDDPKRHEFCARINRLVRRGMTTKAARIVVNAAMFGEGCIEGQKREQIQKEIDEQTP